MINETQLYPIPRAPNYLITRTGKIWSQKSHKWLKSGSVMGYSSVVFCDQNIRSDHIVARLVLETFISPCPKGEECRHLDGNKQNSNLSNLCWGTRLENRHDEFAYKGHCRRICKLIPEQVRIIFHLINSAEQSMDAIGKLFNVTGTTIRHIRRGYTWSNVTGF